MFVCLKDILKGLLYFCLNNFKFFVKRLLTTAVFCGIIKMEVGGSPRAPASLS